MAKKILICTFLVVMVFAYAVPPAAPENAPEAQTSVQENLASKSVALDTGWTLLQREYPPLAIHKVKNHLMNLHVRDIDGMMRSFVHIGQGVMDFEAVAEALEAVHFTGFLSIEQDKHPGDMEATCRRYLQMMRRYL